MLYVQLFALFVYEALFYGPISVGLCRKIHLEQNGYEGIIVGIDHNIPQVRSNDIFSSLKKLFNISSRYLYQSTRKRSYFSKVTILVPPTWSREPEMNLSKSEIYESVDIKIEALSPIIEPHVDGMSVECGEGGQSIIMPEDFLSYVDLFATFGGDHDPARWFVQLWSQFQFGVYDEHGYAGDKSYPYFYLDEKMTIPMPTACTTADLLLGNVVDVRSGKPCTTNEEILYGGFCEYQLSHTYDITNSSINYAYYFSPISQFCDTDENMHNDRAPTKQNAYCSYQSTWSVIEKNSDFQNGSNEPREITDVTPQIMVVYPSPRFIVLAFDCSEKSHGWTLQGVSSFIKYRLTFGTYIGVIAFSSDATTVLNITEVKTETDRQMVLDSLPTTKAGLGTCIGCALQESLNMFKETTTGNGGVIVIISDGNETMAPFVSDIYADVVEAEVQVYWIAYGNEIGDELTSLVTETRGQVFSIDSDIGGVAAFSSALFLIANYGQAFQKTMLTANTVTCASDPDTSVSGEMLIDWNIGKEITVIALYDPGYGSSPQLEVVGPISSMTMPVFYDNASKDGVLAATIPLAMPGSWTYRVEGGAPQQDFSITVASAARIGGKPRITLEAWTNVGFHEVNWTERPIILFASLKLDSFPILNANVIAKVTGPCKITTEVPLYDGGNVPDFQKLDGVYSRYFSSFCGSGRYRFQVSVHGGLDAMDHKLTTYNGVFQRVIEGGSFMIVDYSYSKMNDTIPPSRILDLRVMQNSSLRALSSALLEWTAPGDDYDRGSASYYEMKFSQSFSMVRGDEFVSNSNVVSSSMILYGSLNPMPAGSQQWVVVHFPSTYQSYFVAITSFDDAGNSPQESNIVQIIMSKTCQYQGQTFQDPDDCSVYYVCEAAFSPPTQMTCPSGLCYHSDTQACEWPY